MDAIEAVVAHVTTGDADASALPAGGAVVASGVGTAVDRQCDGAAYLRLP